VQVLFQRATVVVKVMIRFMDKSHVSHRFHPPDVSGELTKLTDGYIKQLGIGIQLFVDNYHHQR
jgi:hypothetical protein